MWNKTTYWTLREVIEFISQWNTKYDTGKFTTTDTLFKNTLTEMFEENDLTTEQKSQEAETLWTGHIVGKYADCFCVWDKISDELSDEKCYKFFSKFLHIFNETWFKYKNMLDIYNDNLAQLMNPMNITSENKFNDTPQNAQGSYDWGDDDHLTNITKNTTQSDGTTKINRIKEIENQLSNLYDDWASEFRGLFIYE